MKINEAPTPEDRQGQCLCALLSPEVALERLAVASTSLAYLANYRESLAQLERCDNMAGPLRDRAYEAERHVRILLKVGLDSLNDLTDSGMFGVAIQRCSEIVRESGALPIPEAFDALRSFFAQHSVNTACIDEAAGLLAKHDIVISAEGDGLLVKISNGVQAGEYVIEPRPHPGDLGRIGSKRFFCEGGSGFTMVSLDQDHRHRDEYVSASGRHVHRLDVYGETVAVFNAAKETIYRHARTVEMVGRPHLHGRDPVTIITIGAAVVAAVFWTSVGVINVLCVADKMEGDVCILAFVLLVAIIIVLWIGACFFSAGASCQINFEICGDNKDESGQRKCMQIPIWKKPEKKDPATPPTPPPPPRP
jgi:hypothetical protein